MMTLAVLPTLALGKSEEWTGPQGKKFNGEPSALLGPVAVFSTGLTTTQCFPLHILSDEDCVRFATQLSTKPQQAQDWSQAKSRVSSEIIDNVKRIENGKLVAANLKGIIEPEFYIIFYASNGVSDSWGMMGSSIWKFQEMQKQYPGMVEGLFFGLDHTLLEHNNMALSSKLPWLVANYSDEEKMHYIRRIGPEQAPLLLIITRDGTPMFATRETDEKKIGDTLDQLSALLKLMHPENPKSWGDRVHYLQALQLANHRTGETAPILVGNPLNAEMIKKYDVKKFQATLQVAQDGTVKTATIAPGFEMPQKMVTPITNALTRALFVPAVQNGQCVESSFEYKFEAAH
jgi:hypothetical protein